MNTQIFDHNFKVKTVGQILKTQLFNIVVNCWVEVQRKIDPSIIDSTRK